MHIRLVSYYSYWSSIKNNFTEECRKLLVSTAVSRECVVFVNQCYKFDCLLQESFKTAGGKYAHVIV